jgi:hypothetical protein
LENALIEQRTANQTKVSNIKRLQLTLSSSLFEVEPLHTVQLFKVGMLVTKLTDVGLVSVSKSLNWMTPQRNHQVQTPSLQVDT